MQGARRTRKAPKPSGFGFADLTNTSPEKQLGVITGVARASEAASSAAPDFITRSPAGSVGSSAADGSQTSGNPTDDLGQVQSSIARSSTGRLSSRSATSSRTASPNKTSRGSIRSSQAGDEDWENILNDPISPRKSRGKRKGSSVQRDLSQTEMTSPIAHAPTTSSSVGTPSIRPTRISLGGSQRSVSFENSSLTASKRERSRSVVTGLVKGDAGNNSAMTNKSPVIGALKSLQGPTAKDTSTPLASEDMLPDFTSAGAEPEPDVPAFMSGWDGAAGWGDELDLDDDDEALGDAWRVDISIPGDVAKREEPAATNAESVAPAAIHVAKTEKSKSALSSSAPEIHAQSAASVVTYVPYVADHVIDKDEMKMQIADTSEEYHSDSFVESEAKPVIAGNDVAADASEITKELSAEESRASTAFGGFESWEGQTLAPESAPVVTGGDGAEVGTKSYDKPGAEPDPWASSFGKAQESSSVPSSSDKISIDKTAVEKVDVSETEIERSTVFNGIAEAAITTVDSVTAPSQSYGEQKLSVEFANQTESSSNEYVMGTRAPEGIPVPGAHAQISQVLPPSHLEIERPMPEQIPSDNCEPARNILPDKSGASDDSFANAKKLGEVRNVDDFPVWGPEQIQTPVVEEQFAGFDYNGAAVSVSEPITSAAKVDEKEPFDDKHAVARKYVDDESRTADNAASNLHDMEDVRESGNCRERVPGQTEAPVAEERFAGFESYSAAAVSVSEPVTSAAKVDEKQTLSDWYAPARNFVDDELGAVDDAASKPQAFDGNRESDNYPEWVSAQTQAPVAEDQFVGFESKSATVSVSEPVTSAAKVDEKPTLSDWYAPARNFNVDESIAVDDTASKPQAFDGNRESDKYPEWVPAQTQAPVAEDQFGGFESKSATVSVSEPVTSAANVDEKPSLSDWYAPARNFVDDESIAVDDASSKPQAFDGNRESDKYPEWVPAQTQAPVAEDQFDGFESKSATVSVSEPVTSAAKVDEKHMLSDLYVPARNFDVDESIAVDDASSKPQAFDGNRESDKYPEWVPAQTQAPVAEDQFGFESKSATVSVSEPVTSAANVDEKPTLPDWYAPARNFDVGESIAVDDAASKPQAFNGNRESDKYPEWVPERTQAPVAKEQFGGFESKSATVSVSEPVTSAANVDEKPSLSDWYAPARNFNVDESIAVDDAASKPQAFDGNRESDKYPEWVPAQTQAPVAEDQFDGFESKSATISVSEPVTSAANVDEKPTLSDWYAPARNFNVDESIAVDEWVPAQTQAPVAEDQFGVLESKSASVSVSEPVATKATTDSFQVESMQGASTVSAKEQLAFPGSTWHWGGGTQTDTVKGGDYVPRGDYEMLSFNDKESKCLEEEQRAIQEEYGAPKPVPDTRDVWKRKQPGQSSSAERRASLSASSAENSVRGDDNRTVPIAQVAPSIRATDARGEIQSPRQRSAWTGAAVENDFIEGEHLSKQDADGGTEAVNNSVSSSSRGMRSPVVDDMAYQVTVKPATDTSNVDWAWGQADAMEAIPSAVASAWEEFDAGIEDTKQKSGGEIDGTRDSNWESTSHTVESKTQEEPKTTRSSTTIESPKFVTGDRLGEEVKPGNVSAPQDWHWQANAVVTSERCGPVATIGSLDTVQRFEVDDQVRQVTQESRMENELVTGGPEFSNVHQHDRNVSHLESLPNTTGQIQTSESIPHDPFEAWATSASAPEPVEWSLTGFAEDTKLQSTSNVAEPFDVVKSVPSAVDEYRTEERPIVTEDYAPSSSPFAPTSAYMATTTQPNLDASGMWSTSDVPVASWGLSAQNFADSRATDINSERSESEAVQRSVSVNNDTAQLTATREQDQFPANIEGNATASSSGDPWSIPAQQHSTFLGTSMQTNQPAPERSSSISDRPESVKMSEHDSRTGILAQELTGVETRARPLTEVHNSKSASAVGYANQFWADKLRDPVDVPTSVEERRPPPNFSEDLERRADESVFRQQPIRGTAISDFNSFQPTPTEVNAQGYFENSYAPKPVADQSPTVPRSAEMSVGPERRRTSQMVSSQNTLSLGRQSPYPPSPAISSPPRSESEIRDAGDNHEIDSMSYAPRTTPALAVLPKPMPSRGSDVYGRKMAFTVDEQLYPVSRGVPTSDISANLTSLPDSNQNADVTTEFYGLAPDHGADLWSADYSVPYEQGHENTGTGQTVDASQSQFVLSEPQAPVTGYAGYKSGAAAEIATDQVWSGATISQSDPYAPYGVAQDSIEPFLQPRQIDQAFPDDAFAANYSLPKVSAPADPYSFQFSIMDSNAPDDILHERTPRSFMSWGFGGSLCIISPKCSTDMTVDNSEPAHSILKATTTVCVYDMATVSQDSTSEDWTVSLEIAAALSSPSTISDLEPYAAMCERLSSYSIGSDKLVAESRSFLWRLLAVLCRNAENNWHAQFASVLTGPVSVPLFNKKGMSSDEMVKDSPLRIIEGNAADQASAACEVERLLCNGGRENAVQVAQRAGLWSLALVISASLNRDIYMRTVSDFARERLSNGAALQTLCLSMSENDEELIRLSTSSDGVKNWKKTVSVLLERAIAAGGSKREMVAIEKIGRALVEQRKDFPAAHICFLICGKIKALEPSGDGGVGLLGGDPNVPAGRPRSCGTVASVVQSMVYEAVYQVQHGKGFPHLLPFRLIVALNLASVGRSQLALQHCEALVASVRTVLEEDRSGNVSQRFTAPFLANLEALEQRLRLSLGGGQSGGASSTFKSLKASLSSVFKKSSDTLPQPVHASPPHAPDYEKSHTSSTTAVSNAPISTDVQPRVTPTASESSEVKQDTAANTWNQLVSNTINALAPDQGDLSPPVRPRQDVSLDNSAFEASFGYGSDPQGNFMHMRSASHGDVPSVMPMASAAPPAQFWHSNESGHDGFPVRRQGYPPAGYSEQLHPQSGAGFPSGDRPNSHRQQRSLDESEAHSHSSNALNDMASMPRHRRSSSDITHHESRTSEKPPRPPKRASAKAATDDDRSGAEATSSRPAKSWGWKSRLSEKIRSTFLGNAKQAHMGEENKFVFDKEKGRWIIPGEESEDVNDVPPPPPDDEALSGNEMTNFGDPQHPPSGPPSGGSYGSLPQQPDFLNDGSWSTAPLGPSMYASATAQGQQGSHNQVPAYAGTGTMSGNDSASMSGFGDNMSESSVGSVASAPIPRSRMHADVQPPVRNKFRASHKLSGRRAYVDTFNTGVTSSSVPPIRPPARVAPNSVGSSPAGGVKIFTPAPAAVAQGNSAFSGVRHSASFDDTSSNASVSDMSSSAQNINVQNSYSDALPPSGGPSHSESYMSDTSASAPTYGSQRRASDGPRQPHMRA